MQKTHPELQIHIGSVQGNTQIVCAPNVPTEYAEAAIHFVQYAEKGSAPHRVIVPHLVAQE